MTSKSWHRSSIRVARAGLLAAAVCAGAVGVAAGEGAAAGSGALGPRALRERARAVLLDPRFQEAAPATAGPPAAPQAPAFSARLPAPRWRIPPLFALSGVASLVVYILAGVLLALLAAWVIQEAGLRRARRRAPLALTAASSPSVEGSARPAAGETSAGDAHRLAGQGRYAEAVHALLLAAIRQLAARSSKPPDPSRTSRELARTLPLEPGARAAFGELVAAVERSLFGGAAVDRQGFDASLACFRAVFGRQE
ncbi:MAG TPA: DUF4129 domain-containing protein [Thermoanaerobaculia bacterium]